MEILMYIICESMYTKLLMSAMVYVDGLCSWSEYCCDIGMCGCSSLIGWVSWYSGILGVMLCCCWMVLASLLAAVGSPWVRKICFGLAAASQLSRSCWSPCALKP